MESRRHRSEACRSIVRWLHAVTGAAALCFVLPPTCITAQEQSPVSGQNIRVDVDRVNVGVIVTDVQGNFVEGLQRRDFRILDSGNVQPITDFAPVDAPAQVLLLLEVGPAVYLLQDSHLFVANALLNGLSAGDRVGIVVYNNAPTALLDFTADKLAVGEALDRIQFNLGFGNLNLALSLNTVLDWLERVPEKKTIVLVSSGVDTSPADDMQSLLSRLQAGDVRILSISMSGPLRNGNKGSKQQIRQTQQAFEQADTWLKTLSDATGGRAYFPENAKGFEAAYKQIAELVRHEYSLAFAPPKADGATHTIDVRIVTSAGTEKTDKDPNNPVPEYRVDHRRGYIAPKPQQ
jgi:Ca-activated chloride channel family protein